MDRWSRRQFVQGVGVAGLALVAGCGRLPGQGQAPVQVPRVGVLAPTSRTPYFAAFEQGLRDLGYVDGQNLIVEYRWAEGSTERLPSLAAELVGLPVDLLVAVAPGNRAALGATSTIPIVGVHDPNQPIHLERLW